MGDRTLRRRDVLLGAGVTAGGVALTGVGATPAAAAPEGDHLSGSWLVTRHDNPPGDTSSVRGVVSFAGGDVLITQDIDPGGQAFTGTWAARGSDGFKGTMWSWAPGDNGAPGPSLRVHLRGSRHGDTISGTYTFTVFAPGGTNVVQTGTGSFTGHRIEA